MTPSDAVDRLTALANDPAPPLDPDATTRLEQRLQQGIHDTGPVAQSPGGPSSPLRRRALLTVAAAILMVVVAVPLLGDDRPELLAADGVVLSLPDGTTRTAAAGDRLSDGTEIRVTDGGFAVVDGVRIPGGTLARIVAGRVVLQPEAPAGPRPGGGADRWFPFPDATNDERSRTVESDPAPGRPAPTGATVPTTTSAADPVGPTTSTTTSVAPRPTVVEHRPTSADEPVTTTERTTSTTVAARPRPADTASSIPEGTGTRTR